MEEMTMCEQSKANTELYLAKIKQLESRTREDLNFLVDQALKSAKMEIALAPIENRADEDLSELAQTIKKYPDFKFDKQVIFKEFLAESMKDDGITSEFTMIETTVGETSEMDNGKQEKSGSEKPATKRHSQARRVKLPMQSIKVDDCEIFISVARLKNTNKKKEDLEK